MYLKNIISTAPLLAAQASVSGHSAVISFISFLVIGAVEGTSAPVPSLPSD
jgi:hypothetical protein